MHGQDALGAHVAQGNGGNGVGEHAVDEHASANFYRQEHAGVGATGANGIDERAGMEDDAFAGRKIGGGDGQRDAQFFESLDLEDAVEESDHALVAGEAVARQSPTGKVFEADLGGEFLEFGDVESAAIGGADESADAGARDKADRNVFFFENFEDADVSQAAGEASAEGQTDTALGVA